jgi:hypothetical protein
MVWLRDNRISAITFNIVEVDPKHGKYALLLECENDIKVFVDTELVEKIVKVWGEI